MVAARPTGPPPERPRLEVVTWNVRHGRPQRGLASNRRLAATVAGLAGGADVLAVQEVDHRVVRSWFRDQARLVGQAMGTDVERRFVPVRRVAVSGHDGVALCVRGTIDETVVERIAGVAGRQARVVVAARVRVGTTAMSVATAHLQNHAPDAVAQLATMVEVLATLPEPRVLVGDLNLCRADVAAVLEPAGYQVADGDDTEPAWAPTQRIDHVAVQGFDIVEVRVPPVAVSDHRPVVASLLGPAPA